MWWHPWEFFIKSFLINTKKQFSKVIITKVRRQRGLLETFRAFKGLRKEGGTFSEGQGTYFKDNMQKINKILIRKYHIKYLKNTFNSEVHLLAKTVAHFIFIVCLKSCKSCRAECKVPVWISSECDIYLAEMTEIETYLPTVQLPAWSIVDRSEWDIPVQEDSLVVVEGLASKLGSFLEGHLKRNKAWNCKFWC